MLEASEEEAYLISVHTNAIHGKPLSLAERLRASSELLERRPKLSDQAIAEVCALSSKTVATQRKALALPKQTSNTGPKSRKRRLSTRVARRRQPGACVCYRVSLMYLTWRWAYNGEAIPADEAYKLERALDVDLSALLGHHGVAEKSGSSFALRGPDERKGLKLGPSPLMIDVLHSACNLWDSGPPQRA